jgi:hypothetical protein
VTVAAGVRPFGRRLHGYSVAGRVENDNDDGGGDVRCTHVFSPSDDDDDDDDDSFFAATTVVSAEAVAARVRRG